MSQCLKMGLPLAWLAACGTTNTVQGKVTIMPGVGADGAYVDARPIAGARVALDCDKEKGEPLVLTSDDRGLVFAQLAHGVPSSCKIRVTMNGYRERTFRVGEACAIEQGETCNGISLSARLVPLGGK